MELFFKQTFMELTPMLIQGIGVVLVITLLSFCGGLIIGLIFALGRICHIKAVRGICIAIIELFRGTPLLVQLFYIYYVIPLIITGLTTIITRVNREFTLPPITAGVIGLMLCYGCYMAEVIRSAIDNIDIGQTEAGMALGCSRNQILFRIVIPQAMRNSIPVFGNYLVMLVKDSSLLSCISGSELLMITKTYASKTFYTIESYTILAAVYFLISFPLSRLVKYVENRMQISNRMIGGSHAG